MNKGICNINGVIGELTGNDGKSITPFVTFLDVASQVERQKDITHLDVYITTPGGLMEEGEDIVRYFESLKAKGITVHTHAEDEVCSFGVDIFLSGEQRFIDSNAKLMIHNPWVTLTEGDASVIETYAKELRRLEDQSVKGYSEKTGTSIEVLKTLMKKDTFLTPEQAVQFGFATEISNKVQLKAVAFSKLFINQKSEEMAKEPLTKKEAETLLDKFANSLKQLFSPKQVKTVQDATGVEIVFTELEPEDTPEVTDVATVDNVPADGDYVMPSGETYRFEAGALAEIIAAKEDVEEAQEELQEQLEEAQEEVAQLKKQLKQLRQENRTLKATVSSNEEKMKGIYAEFKQLKKSISSDYDFEEEERRDDRRKKGKTRQLFKK